MLKAEANCIQNIERGFAITRELADIQATYDRLVSEGRLKTATSDERGGITGKSSITTGSKLKPHQFVSIMHAKIAALRWAKDSAIHYNARDAFPDGIPIRGFGKRRKTDEEKEAVELSKYDLLANAKYGPFNNPLGQVDPTG